MKSRIEEKNSYQDPNATVKEPSSPVCYQNDPEIQEEYQLPAPNPSPSAKKTK
ncbi:hypothetical protein [Cyclobacterium salsum]|uniref:hypothetical protein n=1 Tax=Cyclobacterium salsum TaxID=2666329 RepID=UPI0013917B2A|nr:hypothetical protein [Cyclobacterium salsum]